MMLVHVNGNLIHGVVLIEVYMIGLSEFYVQNTVSSFGLTQRNETIPRNNWILTRPQVSTILPKRWLQSVFAKQCIFTSKTFNIGGGVSSLCCHWKMAAWNGCLDMLAMIGCLKLSWPIIVLLTSVHRTSPQSSHRYNAKFSTVIFLQTTDRPVHKFMGLQRGTQFYEVFRGK